MKINPIKTKLIYLLIFLSINVCLAQTINLQSLPDTTKQFEFRFDKSLYSNNGEKTISSEVYQLNLNIPISSKYNLISSIPYIHTSYTVRDRFGKYHYEKLGFGNIFLGLQTNWKITNNNRSVITAGVFLPTAEERLTFNGLYSGFYDIQKFLPNSMGLYFNYAYHRLLFDNFNFIIEAGPNLIIPTKDDKAEMELMVHYGINAGYKLNKLLFSVELLGMVILTADIYDFSYRLFFRRWREDSYSDRMVHILNFGTQWKGSVVTPKIYCKIYLREEFRDMIDGVLGIGVTVALE